MGSFDVTCAISNIGIHEGERCYCLLLIESVGDCGRIEYTPISPLISGKYADYGNFIPHVDIQLLLVRLLKHTSSQEELNLESWDSWEWAIHRGTLRFFDQPVRKAYFRRDVVGALLRGVKTKKLAERLLQAIWDLREEMGKYSFMVGRDQIKEKARMPITQSPFVAEQIRNAESELDLHPYILLFQLEQLCNWYLRRPLAPSPVLVGSQSACEDWEEQGVFFEKMAGIAKKLHAGWRAEMGE